MRPRRSLPRPRHEAHGTGGKIYIYGRHALAEALQSAPHVIRKVFLARDLRDTDIRVLLEKAGIEPAELSPGRGNDLVGRDTAHQGVIAVIDPNKLLIPFDRFLASLPETIPASAAVAIMGEVQDPHNVGAIIRSAAGFGLSGVLIPEHNQAPLTGVVVKASAGMAFRVPLVSIGNVNAAVAALKQRGFWVYGLAMDGAATLGTEPFNAPSAFIVGNEGTGIREKTLEACDITLKIPMHPRTESLNAAVSAAIVFYEWARKHPEAL